MLGSSRATLETAGQSVARFQYTRLVHSFAFLFHITILYPPHKMTNPLFTSYISESPLKRYSGLPFPVGLLLASIHCLITRIAVLHFILPFISAVAWLTSPER